LLGGFLVSGFLAVPITVLIVVTILAFGPLIGAPSALAGALLSAMTIFCLGRALGRYRVQRFAGRRVAHLSRRIAQRGFWAILIVRILPIAPFSMVNLVAGATPLSLRDFLLGTALGMSPGIVLMSAFVDRLAEALRNPSPRRLWRAGPAHGLQHGVSPGTCRGGYRSGALHRMPVNGQQGGSRLSDAA
jgi:phospholipase D1/2